MSFVYSLLVSFVYLLLVAFVYSLLVSFVYLLLVSFVYLLLVSFVYLLLVSFVYLLSLQRLHDVVLPLCVRLKQQQSSSSILSDAAGCVSGQYSSALPRRELYRYESAAV